MEGNSMKKIIFALCVTTCFFAMAEFAPPKRGEDISFYLKSGKLVSGLLESIEPEGVSLAIEGAVIRYNKEQMTARALSMFYKEYYDKRQEYLKKRQIARRMEYKKLTAGGLSYRGKPIAISTLQMLFKQYGNTVGKTDLGYFSIYSEDVYSGRVKISQKIASDKAIAYMGDTQIMLEKIPPSVGNFYDDMTINVLIAPAGTYSFTTVTGATRTIPKTQYLTSVDIYEFRDYLRQGGLLFLNQFESERQKCSSCGGGGSVQNPNYDPKKIGAGYYTSCSRCNGRGWFTAETSKRKTVSLD